MKKRSGPAFHQQTRPLKRCPACNGQGITRGLFHELPCADCGAAGVVDKATGVALPAEDLLLQLRLRLNRAHEEVRTLRAQLDSARRDPAERGHGPMGKVYHGD